MTGSRRDAVVNGWPKRFVRVAPPTVYAGVGNALRQAFATDGELRSLRPFEDLLTRLDNIYPETDDEPSGS